MPFDFSNTPDLVDLVVTRLKACALDYGAVAASKWEPDHAVSHHDMPYAYHWYRGTFPALSPSRGRLLQPRFFVQRLIIGHLEAGVENLGEGSELYVQASSWLTKVHLYYHINNQLQTSDDPAPLRYVLGIGEDNAAPLVRDEGLVAVQDPSGARVAAIDFLIPVRLSMGVHS